MFWRSRRRKRECDATLLQHLEKQRLEKQRLGERLDEILKSVAYRTDTDYAVRELLKDHGAEVLYQRLPDRREMEVAIRFRVSDVWLNSVSRRAVQAMPDAMRRVLNAMAAYAVQGGPGALDIANQLASAQKALRVAHDALAAVHDSCFDSSITVAGARPEDATEEHLCPFCGAMGADECDSECESVLVDNALHVVASSLS